jgi:RHS repeat-associated protein
MDGQHEHDDQVLLRGRSAGGHAQREQHAVFLAGRSPGYTSLTASSNGAKVAELRYKPWGEARYTYGTTPTSYQFTGQRNDSYIKLYDMGARMYDPELGRFISPDSIIPDPANPQSLNRYAYVYNNPYRYVDRDGHTPLLVTALVGAGIGALVNTGHQVLTTMRANPGQVSFGDALRQVDLGKVVGAAAAGGVMGLTLGVGSAVLGTGFWATTYLGALGGGLGGQVGALTEASWDEGIRMMDGAGFNGERFLSSALNNGFMDPTRFGLDCVTGAISAGAGYQVTKFLSRWLNIPTTSDPKLMKEIVWVDLNKKMVGIRITDFGKTLRMPIGSFEQWMQYLTELGYEVSQGFLEELLQTGAAEWLENQVE